MYGLRQRGSPRDKPFSHKTGKGYVAPHKGHYHDALYVKKLRVVMLLVEALGGIAPPARAHIAKLARRSEGKGATDRTTYGETRISTKSFYVHHSQMLSNRLQSCTMRRRSESKSPALSSGCVLPRMRLTAGRVRKPAPPPASEEGPNGP